VWGYGGSGRKMLMKSFTKPGEPHAQYTRSLLTMFFVGIVGAIANVTC